MTSLDIKDKGTCINIPFSWVSSTFFGTDEDLSISLFFILLSK